MQVHLTLSEARVIEDALIDAEVRNYDRLEEVGQVHDDVWWKINYETSTTADAAKLHRVDSQIAFLRMRETALRKAKTAVRETIAHHLTKE